MLTYPAMLDVPRELVVYVSTLLAANRHAIGTRRGARVLTYWTQALFCLVWFRERREVALAGRLHKPRSSGGGCSMSGNDTPKITIYDWSTNSSQNVSLKG